MASPTFTDYLNFAREYISESEDWSEDQIRAAVQALAQANSAGANRQQAIRAAQSAARAAAPPIAPAPRGMIAGIAGSVQQATQIRGAHGNLQVLNFELDRHNAPSVRVQIRGALLYGSINEGDEVIVKRPPGDSRFIQADHVFNRTTNSEVKAQKGFRGIVSATEAEWGKGPARATAAVTLAIITFVITIFIVITISIVTAFTGLGSVFHDRPWESDTHPTPSHSTVTHTQPTQPKPPAWFCKDAPPGFGC